MNNKLKKFKEVEEIKEILELQTGAILKLTTIAEKHMECINLLGARVNVLQQMVTELKAKEKAKGEN